MNGESRAHGPASTAADDQNTVPRPGTTKLHHTPWEINLDSCPRDIACQFAEAGYQIFPLKPNSKAPATENGFHDAQQRVESVAAQFDNLGLSQTGNIGIAVPDDDFVLDFDPRNGGTNTVVAEMIAAGQIPVTPDGTPDTVVFITGGGGHHFWFKLPQGIDSNRLRGKLRPGVDVKIGGKGYIVAPGSRHPNGGRYGILCGDSIDDIAEAPPALMEELLKPEPKKPAGQPITATATSDSRAWASATIETRLEEMRTCPEGGGGTAGARHTLAQPGSCTRPPAVEVGWQSAAGGRTEGGVLAGSMGFHIRRLLALHASPNSHAAASERLSGRGGGRPRADDRSPGRT